MGYGFGTSSCTMTTTDEPAFVPGVWGPYFSAMIPGAWLNEGGQSAAGAAIDHLIAFHPAGAEASDLARADVMPLAEWPAPRAARSAGSTSDAAPLAGGIHLSPEFLGHRAPLSHSTAPDLPAPVQAPRRAR